MKKQTQFIQKWLSIGQNNCPSFILEKLGEEAMKNILSQKLEQDYNYSIDKKWAKSIYDYCKIENSRPRDFLYRNLTCTLGEMVCSIRFVGGDMAKPAVFIMHKNFELEKIADIKTVGDFLKEEYQNFAPKRIRWFSKEDETALIQQHPDINGDSTYIAGYLEDLQANFTPKKEVVIEKATHLDWYKTYAQEYNDLLVSNPLFAEMGEMTTKETFQDLINQNLVFDIRIKNEWAGVIAASKENHSYFIGYEIYEEFIIKKHRGKGYAPATQRLLIEKLDANKKNMLWGTIHHENIASLKTALSNGRKKCGMYIFYIL